MPQHIPVRLFAEQTYNRVGKLYKEQYGYSQTVYGTVVYSIQCVVYCVGVQGRSGTSARDAGPRCSNVARVLTHT